MTGDWTCSVHGQPPRFLGVLGSRAETSQGRGLTVSGDLEAGFGVGFRRRSIPARPISSAPRPKDPTGLFRDAAKPGKVPMRQASVESPGWPARVLTDHYPPLIVEDSRICGIGQGGGSIFLRRLNGEHS